MLNSSNQNTHLIQTEKELPSFTQDVKKKLVLPCLLLLEGNLGSGKTTFCKYLFENYGLTRNQVKSPTYSLINNFHLPHLQINHIDLYRLEKSDPILMEEIRQLTDSDNSLTVIEWPERLELDQLIREGLQTKKIKFTILDNNSREITIENLN